MLLRITGISAAIAYRVVLSLTFAFQVTVSCSEFQQGQQILMVAMCAVIKILYSVLAVL